MRHSADLDEADDNSRECQPRRPACWPNAEDPQRTDVIEIFLRSTCGAHPRWSTRCPLLPRPGHHHRRRGDRWFVCGGTQARSAASTAKPA